MLPAEESQMTGARSARAGGWVLAAAVVAATPASAFAAARLRLVNEGDPGPLYECDVAACVPAQTDDPSRQNRSRMDFYVLPAGCVELTSVALRGDGVDVECGPPGGSTRYRCEAGACGPLDPGAGDQGANERPLPLPAECGGRIHEVIVLGAGTRAPRTYVECDASSGPVREM
jgi:hypothetical protein